MTVTHATRPASPDEIVAEMDRRGAVIERLELEIQGMRLNYAFRASSVDGNRAIMKRRLDELRENRIVLITAGEHLAVKLADVYRAAGQKPADCQAIRDWMTAIAKSEGRP